MLWRWEEAKLLNLWMHFGNSSKDLWGNASLFLTAVVMAMKLTASLLSLSTGLLVLEHGCVTHISRNKIALHHMFFSIPLPFTWDVPLAPVLSPLLASGTGLVPGAGKLYRNNLTCNMLAHWASSGFWPLSDGQLAFSVW